MLANISIHTKLCLGLFPTNKEAVRVITDKSGNTTVQNGPFDGPSVGGYVVLNVADINEAVELVKSFPNKPEASGVEIRRIVNINDMPVPDEVKAKAKHLRYGMHNRVSSQDN